MEIYSHSAELQGRRENNLWLSAYLEMRGMTLGQGHYPPLG